MDDGDLQERIERVVVSACKDTGEVGDGFLGDAAPEREECYAWWGGDQR